MLFSASMLFVILRLMWQMTPEDNTEGIRLMMASLDPLEALLKSHEKAVQFPIMLRLYASMIFNMNAKRKRRGDIGQVIAESPIDNAARDYSVQLRFKHVY